MKTPYRFTKRKTKPYYEVMFAHIPGKWFSTKSDNLAGAVQFAESKIKGIAGTGTDLTLNEFAKDFFTPADPQGYRHRLLRRGNIYDEQFFKAHQSRLDNYILKAHGAYNIRSIKDVMIEDFILDIPKISNNTKNKILTCYRTILKEAVRQGYTDYNEADKVRELPETPQTRETFTFEEIQRLFPENDEELITLWNHGDLLRDSKDGLKWAVFFLIQKDTGWRPGEVAALQKINYFPELRGIYTDCDVSSATHKITNHIKTTKKGIKFKNGFLTEQTDRLLQKLIAYTYSDYLFLTKGSRRDNLKFIYANLANKRLRNMCKYIGINIGKRTQYSFRHTFNTNALGNIPEQARLLLMGHTSNRQEYNHLTPEESLKRAQRLLQQN